MSSTTTTPPQELVDNQDRARDFYTDVLGFEVKDDAPYGPDGRWEHRTAKPAARNTHRA